MAFDFSPEQQRAVNDRSGNILVAAGAGSGKTTVLVERVLSRLSGENPTDIDRLLVLTFTNAAAAEMRARIEDGLTQRLREWPGNAHFTRQLALIQQAPITTIHSFCLDLVRRNFYRLGLDAGFRIPSETERAILHEETLATFMEEQYEREDDVLSALADCYGGQRGDAGLLTLVDELYGFSRSQPHPEAWLRGAALGLAGAATVDDYSWSAFLLHELKMEAALARRGLDMARQLAATQDIPLGWLTLVTEEIAAVNRLLATENLTAFLTALPGMGFATLPAAAKQGDAAAKQEFRRLRDGAKEALRDLQKRYGRRGASAMEADLRALAPLLQRLATLVIDYGAALTAEKRRRNLLDFADMEHFCLQLLEDEPNGVAAELSASFDELLIDEYQDINAVQERILSLLARGDNCFAVGDVKQSIYRFRLAEPTLFLQKYHDYGAGAGGVRIDLNKNYRSSGNVIAAVNFLFRQLMSEQVAELDYDTRAELAPGRKEQGAAVELWLVERAETEAVGRRTEDGKDVGRDARSGASPGAPPVGAIHESPAFDTTQPPDEHILAAEARLIGRRVLELHQEGYAFSDMAVLLRATKNRESVLAEELARMGIPALAANQADYLQTPEIGLMLSLLAVVDNPLQEPELAATLRSPLFGFSLDELAAIRFAAPEQQLMQGLAAVAAGQDELAEKCRLFLARLNEWREALRCCRVSELIWRIYRETGLLQLAGALPQGGQRQENLLLLYQRAREYEAGSYRGLFRFLLFLADGRGKGGDSGTELAEGEEAVRVMSIHRSKGLEFPVVFAANLHGAFSLLDERRDVIWHKRLGLAAKVVERRQRRKFPSLAHEAVARSLHKEALAEEMRVLYVALTRARERLILSAGLKDIPKAAAVWAEEAAGQGPRLQGALLAQDKRALDWLGKALIRHPDAAVLRAAAGVSAGSAEERSLLIPSESRFSCHIVHKDELAPPEYCAPEQLGLMIGPGLPPSPAREQVEAALGWQYPWRDACDYAAKWTVSELNRFSQMPPQQTVEEAAPLIEAIHELPAAAQDEGQAARRGTAQHKLLQYLDFSRADGREEVATQLAQLCEQGVFSIEEAALIEVERIARFAASPLAARFSKAERCLREAAFTYALPTAELQPGAAPQDKLVLQGMIDAAFWEEGGWVLLDYKTGGHGQAEQQLKQRYAAQLGYYRRALQDIWGQPVKEAWLCFLDLGKNIKL